MNRRHFLMGTSSLALVTAAGCATTPPAAVFPELTWGHLPPLRLLVDDVQVINAYTPPGVDPYVDHAFPTPPALAAFRWAKDRLVAAGGNSSGNIVVATILEGQVQEVRLQTTGGLTGALKTEQAERYDGRLTMRVELFAATGAVDTVSVSIDRTQSVLEGITVSERRQVWFEYTEAMMAEFNGRMEDEIRRRMRDYLVS